MRRTDSERQQRLQELRESLDQRGFFQEGEEGRSFAARVRDEMTWIDEERILGSWGEKGAHIRYDKKELGERCRDARMKKGYPLKEVAKRLSYKSHSYLSKIEHGKKDIDPCMLEGLSLLYHVMPKYLLGLEEKPPEAVIFFADRYEDQCRFLIQNSISDPKSFGFPAEQSLDERLDYIKSITTLGCVTVSAARSIMEISAKIPSLQRINTAKKPTRSKFPQGLLPPPRQLMSLGTDSPEYKEANEAWRKLQVTLDRLYENDPEWLAFIAQAIAKGPKCFSTLVDIVRLGGFTSSEETP